MKTKPFREIPTKVVAEVRDGSLINIDETKIVEKALGRSLEWEEVPDSRQTAGSYFQCLYQVVLPNREARIAKDVIQEYRKQFDV